jgi:hypothetical protein
MIGAHGSPQVCAIAGIDKNENSKKEILLSFSAPLCWADSASRIRRRSVTTRTP